MCCLRLELSAEAVFAEDQDGIQPRGHRLGNETLGPSGCTAETGAGLLCREGPARGVRTPLCPGNPHTLLSSESAGLRRRAGDESAPQVVAGRGVPAGLLTPAPALHAPIRTHPATTVSTRAPSGARREKQGPGSAEQLRSVFTCISTFPPAPWGVMGPLSQKRKQAKVTFPVSSGSGLGPGLL